MGCFGTGKFSSKVRAEGVKNGQGNPYGRLRQLDEQRVKRFGYSLSRFSGQLVTSSPGHAAGGEAASDYTVSRRRRTAFSSNIFALSASLTCIPSMDRIVAWVKPVPVFPVPRGMSVPKSR